MNKIKILLYALLIFILLAWNNKIVPKRLEISEIETVRVLGLDNNSEDVMMTIIRENESSEDSSEGEQSGNSKQEVVSIISSNFSKAVKALQNYKSKSFAGGHVKYIIIGEDMAKNNFVDAIEFVAREVELRLTAQMYIAREMTANEIISSEGSSKEKMADVLNNLNKNINAFGISKKQEVLDVLELIVNKKKCDLIPTLMTADKNIYNKEWEIKSTEETEAESTIEFAGYGIIKGAKLIDYLSLEESRGANFVNNSLDSTVITLGREEAKDISLDLISSDTEIKFLFDEEELMKIKVINKNRSNITQIVTENNVLDEELLRYLEQKQAEIIKNEIEMAVNKSQTLNADFLNFEGQLRLKHPYKYERIKDKWDEIFKEVPIEVSVESRVRRLYDVLDLESEE